MTNPRLLAYQTMRDVRLKDSYANLVLQNRIANAKLSARDAAFATELTSGTLRNKKTYDRIIELASGRKLNSLDRNVLDILRLGTHQLLNTRVAVHACVNESVNLTKQVGRSKAAGFVNAIMRKISQKNLDEWITEIKNTADSKQTELAEVYSHPEWIISSFQERLVYENRQEELAETLISNNIPPKVSVVALTEASLNALVSRESHENSQFKKIGPSPTGFELEFGDPETEIFKAQITDGSLRVQDQGSQLAALALINAKNLGDEKEWLDLCAGPGGKTAVLAAEAKKHGISLHANEISEHRAELVKKAVHAFADTVAVSTLDGRDDEAFKAKKYDRIMVDAPCSGLGALRRRPEARWRKKEADLEDLTTLQKELLQNAANHLADLGVISYVTCSPELRETRGIVDDFLLNNPDFIELNAKETVQKLATEELDLGEADELSVQLWPHRHNTDAMFISLLQKKSSIE